MTNFKRTRCVIYAITQHDSTAENSPRTLSLEKTQTLAAIEETTQNLIYTVKLYCWRWWDINGLKGASFVEKIVTTTRESAARSLAKVLGTGVLQNVAELSLEGILFGQVLPSRLSRRRRFPHIDFYHNKYLGHQPQEGNLPGHYHPWTELATVLEGRLNVVWDATVYESHAGDWLVFPRNILHAECSLMSRQAYRVFWFIMLPDTQLGLHETSYNRRLGYQLEYACRLADVPTDLRRAVDWLSQGQCGPLEKARWELIKLVNWCVSGLMGGSAETVDLYHPIVNHAQRILQESTGRPPTVADLAGCVGLSPNYLSNLFHRYTGQTIREFVANHRIELARRYLADPKRSVKEIGYQLGFATKQHFTHTFRRIMGLTPTAYRQSLLQRQR